MLLWKGLAEQSEGTGYRKMDGEFFFKFIKDPFAVNICLLCQLRALLPFLLSWLNFCTHD